MRFRHLIFIGFYLLALSVPLSLLLAGSVLAEVERIKIDAEQDTAYLPYQTKIEYSDNEAYKRIPARHTIRVIKEKSPDNPDGRLIQTLNAKLGEDVPADIAYRHYPSMAHIDELPVKGEIVDVAIHQDHDTLAVVMAVLRQDTAWIVRWRPSVDRGEWLFAATGTDKTGDGKWGRHFNHLLTNDYDFDGHMEMFFDLNPVRDMGPRALYCIDLKSFTIEWQVPIASPIHVAYDCRDSINPGVLVATEAPGQGHSDSLFSDNLSYVIRIGQNGKIAFTHIKCAFPFAANLRQGSNPSTYYVGYSVADDDSARAEHAIEHIECIDAYGNILHQRSNVRGSYNYGRIDFGNDGKSEYSANDPNGVYRFYDDTLKYTVLVELGRYLTINKTIARFDGKQDALACDEADGSSGIYDLRFNKLASIPHGEDLEVLERGENGEVLALAVNDYHGEVYRVRLTKRGLYDLAAIFYRRNQFLILATLLSAFSAFVVSNFYRRRAKSDVATINRQKSELEATHEALKQAQATIIAQEKYRQAKDIAGGFAHEIKNALFPADTAMIKLSELAESGALQKETLDKYLRNINASVVRAVRITNLISQYTKLDSQYVPEKVDLSAVVAEVISANQSVIEREHVTVTANGPAGIFIVGNKTQFGIVITNLLLNAIDALTNRPNRTIIIQWEHSGDWVTLAVTDSGAGIPEDILPRVFDTFFSTKPNRGTGLGLSISRKIIEMYGGSIRATSQSDIGTRFELHVREHVG